MSGAEPKTVIQAFFDTAARRGGAPCARFKRDGRWRSLSWEEMSCGVLRLAEELIDRGVRHGERIALLGSTSVEWTMADCAILAAGAVCVPIYLQLTAEQIAHILRDSRPKLLFAEEGAMGKLSAAMKISSQEIPVLPLERVLADASGPRVGPPVGRDVMAVVADLEMRDEATIVYTSGTTGVQKGVVLTHGNLAAEIRGARRAFDFGDDDVGLAFLPLAFSGRRALPGQNMV